MKFWSYTSNFAINFEVKFLNIDIFCYRQIGLQVFDVGSANPQRVLGLYREVKHGGVVGGVGDEGGGHYFMISSNISAISLEENGSNTSCQRS